MKKVKQAYEEISVDLIKEPVDPARTDTIEKGMEELIVSVKQRGIIEPLVLKKVKNEYEIIAGHRRYLAAVRAGLQVVPAMIRAANEEETVALMLHENMYREDMSDCEEAEFFRRILEKEGMTQSDLAKSIGKTPGYISQKLQILKYPDVLREGLKMDKVSFTVARELMGIKDEEARDYYIEAAVLSGANTYTVEGWVRGANNPPPSPPDGRPSGDKTQEVGVGATYKPMCWLCGEAHELADLLTVQIDKNCAMCMREAYKEAQEEPAK